MSIYKGTTKVCGTGVQLDNTLNADSNNAVTNATITNALEDVGYSTWQKPADWIDIRSAAIDNSIYFLVGHAADYSKYPEFSIHAEISNSGTYDVYIDGFKQATTASATDTVLNWQTLALQTGWDVTYPEALRTHIVRVTPSVNTNTITKIYLATNSSVNQGVLWAHFAITNAIDATRLFNWDSNYIKCLILEAVTAVGDVIKISTSGSMGIFRYCENLQYIPVLDFEKRTQALSATFQSCKKLKKVNIKNMGSFGATYYFFIDCNELRKIECDGVFKCCYGAMFTNCYKLETLPPFTIYNTNTNIDIENASGLKDTVLDFSYVSLASRIIIHGTSNNPMRGIKGIILNTAINLAGTTYPQIDVRYTGLDRSALVNLFNSMPTVTGTKVCTITGSTGANDLTAADLAIATNKGWTITR